MELEKKLEGNDIYFLEVLGDKIVVNDNYSGLLIYDSELNLLQEIKLMDGFVIESFFRKGKKILLICPENDSLIYLNLAEYQCKIMSLAGWEEWIFSPLFEWQEDNIILSDYEGRLVRVDLVKEEISEMVPDGKDSILEQKQKLHGFFVEKMFLEEKKAVVQNEDGDLELVDYADGISTIIGLPEGEFYDFEMQEASIAEISEDCVLETNLEDNECREYFPENGYCFVTGKYMIAGQQQFLVLLSSNKADAQRTKIERHLL